MSKSRDSSKSQGSAAVRRREQQRKQEISWGKQPQSRNGRRMQRRNSGRRAALLVGGVLLVIAIIVVYFIFTSSQPNSSGPDRTVASASVVNAVTKVDPALLSQIGTGGVANPFKASGSSTPLNGPTGKPEVFFYGAEWCPYCAAERWSIVAALSRFGTFHNLGETSSSSTDSYPNTATFTFYQSSYSSSYIDFVSIENGDRQRNTLQTPNAAEQQILTTYNVAGYPFMDFGNRYLIENPSYDPAVLRSNPQDTSSQPLTQQQIASQLSTENTLSQNVLGTANYLTAAICSITKNQPSQVCSETAIQSIETSIAQTSQSNGPSGGSSLLSLASFPAIDVRRW
jgi:thiol-disulfide isomerase/thioredoxin